MKTWLIDFEFRSASGYTPHVWCVVGHCLETGDVVRLWLDGAELTCPFPSPYRMVAHFAVAELTCFDVLGWEAPAEVVDTFAEARAVRGQVHPLDGWGQLSVARWLGVPAMGAEHKEEMRNLAMSDEIPADLREPLLDYCQSDVVTLAGIWERLWPLVDMEAAVLRGRYLKALAKVENRGIPVDSELVSKLQENWEDIKETMRAEAAEFYGSAITSSGSFSAHGWLEWCKRAGIQWPRLYSGALALDEDTFKTMADLHPGVRLMTSTRKMLSKARAFGFPLGDDGRFRCMLSPFGSDTGRNQPSTTRYIFGASAWLRSVIQAPPGRVLAYIDYSSQEFALAAELAGDQAMLEDYRSGDPYLAFARRAGAVPADATRETHPQQRAAYKIAALAVQYGMQERSLASSHGMSIPQARRLIAQHQEAYPRYWEWRQSVADTVLCGGVIATRYGWPRRQRTHDKGTSITNFPVQASGAEILRIAVIALEEAGHKVVATIHDAVLVEMDEQGWEGELPEVLKKLDRSAKAVAPGVEIRTDVEVLLPGQHFADPRGTAIWEIVGPVVGLPGALP